MSEWNSIETAPIGRKMFVAIGITSGNEHTGGVAYRTDPYCIWQDKEGQFSRWPHRWGPTHWAELPDFPKL